MIALGCAVAAAAPAGARECDELLRVRFVESAPRDRFELRAGLDLRGTIETLRIELAGAAGGLLFDTEEGGGGVEVFQPFRSESASDGVEVVLDGFPGDGATRIDLGLEGFGAGARFAFSIDVDDTAEGSSLGPTRVAGAEIEGATVAFTVRYPSRRIDSFTGTFDARAVARVCR